MEDDASVGSRQKYANLCRDGRPSSESEPAASPREEEGTSQGLSEVEVGVLKELNGDQIIKVMSGLKNGKQLNEILISVASDIVSKVKQAVDDQYTTLDEPINPLQQNESMDMTIDNYVGAGVALHQTTSEDIERMARVTPLRLTYDERLFLRLLESTLEVSEYTDKVDVFDRLPPAKRMSKEIKQICAILSGLVVAHHYDIGQKLIKERDFRANSSFFRSVFEIGRRYKILNPERMRDSYGKLIFFLMDSHKPDVAQMLDFDCVAEVKTVASLLAQKKNGKALLKDPLLRLATTEIMSEGKSRQQVQWEIKQKEDAIKTLASKYSTASNYGKGTLLSRITATIWPKSESEDEDDTDLTPDEIEQCLYSLCDHNTYLRFNREPVDKIINYLKVYFNPHHYESGLSLAIASGRGGARLSHSHERQYAYVLQSLTLWREVLHEMLGLWGLAEKDLLNASNPYKLRDTGQGLNRVQDAPLVYRCMYRILSGVQEKVGGWCGSSVIHLGDHNVPNALTFIDKYIQVPRILGPLVLCLDKIPELYASSPGMKQYIDSTFNGPKTLIALILCDFFRHAFDGSGADNFYDAGSCIDGRLTSAWNWCSKIENNMNAELLSNYDGTTPERQQTSAGLASHDLLMLPSSSTLEGGLAAPAHDQLIEKTSTLISQNIDSERIFRKYDISFWSELQTISCKLIELVYNNNNNEELLGRLLTQFQDISELSVEAFPTYGGCWQKYAEVISLYGDHSKAKSIYLRAIDQTRSIDLWNSFCLFLYKEGHLFPLLDALVSAVIQVGCDIRSFALWRELLGLRIKIHNAGVLKNQGTSIHVDPFIEAETKQMKLGQTKTEIKRLFSESQITLLISSTLDLLSDDSQIDSVDEEIDQDLSIKSLRSRFLMEQSFDKIRTTYRHWLSTPTSHLDIVWNGYNEFERLLLQQSAGLKSMTPSAAAKTLTNRMVSSAHAIYNNSSSVYKKLKSKKYFGGFDQTIGKLGSCESPAQPLDSTNAKIWKNIVNRWNRILQFELSNPIQLSMELFIHRMESIFFMCSRSCAYQSQLWFNYFQFLLSANQEKKAIGTLRSACDRFLQSDEFLRLALSDYLLTSGNQTGAESVLMSLLFSSIPMSDHDQLKSNLFQILETPIVIETELLSPSYQEKTSSSVVVLHAINFIRKGLHKAKLVFNLFQSSGPSELFLFFATIIWEIENDSIEAKRILYLGLERFFDDEDYVVGCSNMFEMMGYLELCLPHKIWKKSLFMERRFGSNANEIRRLEKIYVSQRYQIDLSERILTGASDILAETTTYPETHIPDTFTSPLITYSRQNVCHNMGQQRIIEVPELLLSQACQIGSSNKKSEDISLSEQRLRFENNKYHGGRMADIIETFSFGSLQPKISCGENFFAYSSKGHKETAESCCSSNDESEVSMKMPSQQHMKEIRTEKNFLIAKPDTSKMRPFSSSFTMAPAVSSNLTKIPKPIQRFMSILPADPNATLITNIGDIHPIEILMYSLSDAVIPEITIKDYQPILLQHSLSVETSQDKQSEEAINTSRVLSLRPEDETNQQFFNAFPNIYRDRLKKKRRRLFL